MSEGTQRRLAAIVSADVVGYSRLIGADEAGTLVALRAHRKELIDPKIAEHGGRIVKTMGDGLLLEFPSVVDATQRMIDVQQAIAGRNEAVDEDKRIVFRIGVHLGDLVVEGDDIFGDGINVAARLEAFCEAGGVAISGTTHENIAGRIEVGFVDAGDQQLKNIARPVRVWQWTPAAAAAEPATVEAALPLPDKPSIAVLPFDNMSGDADQEFFVDGITEDIITTLSKVPRLFVIARNSSFTYKGQAVDVTQVGRELGVRYILEGSARKAGNRVRITAQLVDGSSGLHLWADRFDGNLDDVFSLQDEITQEIVTALQVTLSDGEQARVWRQRAGDARVYDYFLRGRALFMQFTRRSNLQARELLETAIELNPSYPMVQVYLGFSHADEMRWGWSDDPERSLGTAFKMARQALDLDPDFAFSNAFMAYVHVLRREHDDAIEWAHKAIALGPNSADSHHVAAIVFNYSGLPDEGARAAKQTIRLSPLAYSNHLAELAHSYCLLGQFAEAIQYLRRLLGETPFWRSARLMLVWALHESGELVAAQAEAQALLQRDPRFAIKNYDRWFPYRDLTYMAKQKSVLNGYGFRS